MPKYYDPIDQKFHDINESTFVYLVKIDEHTFRIKAISSGVDRLSSAPNTHATVHWPVSTKTLIEHQVNNPIIFPNDMLSEEPLSLDQVVQNLGFNPNEIPATGFNQSVENWQGTTATQSPKNIPESSLQNNEKPPLSSRLKLLPLPVNDSPHNLTFFGCSKLKQPYAATPSKNTLLNFTRPRFSMPRDELPSLSSRIRLLPLPVDNSRHQFIFFSSQLNPSVAATLSTSTPLARVENEDEETTHIQKSM